MPRRPDIGSLSGLVSPPTGSSLGRAGRILYLRRFPSRGRRGACLSQVTVGERILVHLSWYLRFSDAFECPRETTQEGIAKALGISRAHAALELKRLGASARVEERRAHATRGRTPRKAYFLTAGGARATPGPRYPGPLKARLPRAPCRRARR